MGGLFINSPREREPFRDPLLERLTMGDWGAVGEMEDDVRNDEEPHKE